MMKFNSPAFRQMQIHGETFKNPSCTEKCKSRHFQVYLCWNPLSTKITVVSILTSEYARPLLLMLVEDNNEAKAR